MYVSVVLIGGTLLNIMLFITYVVPTPTVILSPCGSIQRVGNPQLIHCRVVVSGVESSSVMISWMGPGGVSLKNDSRVAVNTTGSFGDLYVSVVTFTYLMKGDEGTYTCNVMTMETNVSQSVYLLSPTSKFNILIYHIYVG